MIKLVDLDRQDYEKYLECMFKILAGNMSRIHDTGNSYDEDFAVWSGFITSAENINFVLFLDGDSLAGYFQYSIKGTTLMIDEIEIAPEYQVKYGIMGQPFDYLAEKLPPDITEIEAYISKNNPRSYRIAEKLGMTVIGENRSGSSYHLRGSCDGKLGKYVRRK